MPNSLTAVEGAGLLHTESWEERECVVIGSQLYGDIKGVGGHCE